MRIFTFMRPLYIQRNQPPPLFFFCSLFTILLNSKRYRLTKLWPTNIPTRLFAWHIASLMCN
ncbi:hypothetical protein D1AOALGA4SA_12671 [Olavius algarvensis Delta 1 endosymbiont]|nr:hypothetical protein D1AOALGA4SA_12671 [Olavius algarvensis Delta 1 endosymbiont]